MHKAKAILTFWMIFLGLHCGMETQEVEASQPIPPPPLPTFGDMVSHFDTNTFFVVGDKAYSIDVLGSGRIAFGLASGGVAQSPDGRTDVLLTHEEFDTGNLITVGGPAINPVTDYFDNAFGVEYTYVPGTSFEIWVLSYSIILDLADYPQEDVCIVYLRELGGRNILLVWGYGWQGTYAGSTFMGDTGNWQAYSEASMVMLRWIDSSGDGLVQMDEISVEHVK